MSLDFERARERNRDTLDAIRRFDRPDLAPEWLKIGRAAADVQIDEKHFPHAFDLPALPAEPARAVAAAR